MRNSAIILAALLTARPTLAAEQCLEVKPNLNIDPAMQLNYAKYADTAHCFLRIDGKVIINRTCHIGVSGDTREWAMNGVAEVYMNHENHDLSDRPFYARFERHGRCRCAIATSTATIRVPVDHPTIDHRERLWDRRSEIAIAPFAIFPPKNWKRAACRRPATPESPSGRAWRSRCGAELWLKRAKS